MDDANLTPFEGEYRRKLIACRIGGSVMILLSCVWCAYQHNRLLQSVEIVENTVGQGVKMPRITDFAFNYGTTLTGIAALGTLVCLAFIWSGGNRIPLVIDATVAGTAMTLVTGLFFEIANRAPLHAIMTRFHG